MRSKKLRRVVYPAIVARGGVLRIKRVIDTVMLLVGLTHHQEPYLFVGVVDEGMTDPGSGGKAHAVARFKFP